MSVGSKSIEKLIDSLPLSVFKGREQIVCTVCGKTFECEESLDRHQLTHYPTCQRCHIYSCNDGKDKFCRKCSLETQVENLLRYNCEMCQKRFSEKSRLVFHVEKECPYNIKNRIDQKIAYFSQIIPFKYVYKCNWCEEEFIFETWVQEHESVCPKRFKIKEVVAIADEPQEGDYGIKTEPTKRPLGKGLRYKCDKCGKRYSEKFQIEFHVQKECPHHIKERLDRKHPYKIVRSNSLEIPKLNRSRFVYKCQWCEEKYVSKTCLREHKKSCRRRTQAKGKPKTNAITCVYFCELCREVFASNTGLQRHRIKCPLRLQLKKEAGITVKGRRQEDVYEIGFENPKTDLVKDKHLCELCGQGFIDETILQRHQNECPMRIQTEKETIFHNNSVEGDVEIKEEPLDDDYEIGPGNIFDSESIKTEPVDTIFEIKIEPEEIISS